MPPLDRSLPWLLLSLTVSVMDFSFDNFLSLCADWAPFASLVGCLCFTLSCLGQLNVDGDVRSYSNLSSLLLGLPLGFFRPSLIFLCLMTPCEVPAEATPHSIAFSPLSSRHLPQAQQMAVIHNFLR